MILGVLVVNDAGQARLVRWYEPPPQQGGDAVSLVRRVFIAVSRRSDRLCNFLEADAAMGWRRGTKIVYRHYATLYFIFVVEETESELGILDLIQVFVETLDRCFESVCELDLIFHADRVHFVLDEVVQGGLVLETNMGVVLRGIDDMARMERQSAAPFASSSSASALAFASSSASSFSSSSMPGHGNTVDSSSSSSSTAGMAAALSSYLSPHVVSSTSAALEMGQSAASTLAQRASSYFS